MSVNRENIIWQSADGTWNRGFFDFYYVGQDSEDFDPEWHVEYESSFRWVRTGLASEDAAFAAWTGANPGGFDTLAWSDETAALCADYDARASAAMNQNRIGG